MVSSTAYPRSRVATSKIIPRSILISYTAYSRSRVASSDRTLGKSEGLCVFLVLVFLLSRALRIHVASSDRTLGKLERLCIFLVLVLVSCTAYSRSQHFWGVLPSGGVRVFGEVFCSYSQHGRLRIPTNIQT